jgi:hypothetical protein
MQHVRERGITLSAAWSESTNKLTTNLMTTVVALRLGTHGVQSGVPEQVRVAVLCQLLKQSHIPVETRGYGAITLSMTRRTRLTSVRKVKKCFLKEVKR